jgi:hypothetical protein
MQIKIERVYSYDCAVYLCADDEAVRPIDPSRYSL